MNHASHDPEVGCIKSPGSAAQGFSEVLSDLYRLRYTGRVLLHFHNGIPRIVEVSHKQIRLSGGPEITS